MRPGERCRVFVTGRGKGAIEDHFDIAYELEATQRERGIPTEVVIYPGAGHAFFNDSRPEAHHKEAANDAWRRTLSLFGKNLRDSGQP